MKTRKLTIILILAAVILAPLALAAAEKGPGSKKDRKKPSKPKPTSRSAAPARNSRGGELGQMLLGPMGKELKLTDKQQKKIEAIVKGAGEEVRQGRKAIQEVTRAWSEAVEEGTEAKIIAAGKTIGEAYAQQGLKKLAITKKLKAELTKEQIQQLKELQTKRQEQLQRRLSSRRKRDDSKKGDPKTGRKPRKSKTKKTQKPEKPEKTEKTEKL